MQKLLYLLLCCLGGASSLYAQGYNIDVELKGYTHGTVYLGHYMGKTTYVMDSAQLSPAGKAVLKGAETQPGGIYLIVLPGKQRYFEILLDKTQKFSITADTANLITGTQFRNSPDNTMFSEYNKFIAKNSAEIQKQLGAARNAEDSAKVRPLMEAFTKQLNAYRAKVVTEHPQSLLAGIFKAMREPAIPPMPKKADGTLDSTYPYRVYKANYGKEVNLADGRLVRTPVLETKLDRYFNQLVAPMPDSVIAEADALIAKTKKDKESFKFVLWWITRNYESSQIMGMDAVFVHLVEKYYMNGDAYWLNEEQKNKIIERAVTIAPNLFGQQAAPLVLQDTASKRASLYDIRSKYTVVVFWDPTCGHCITEVPKLDSAFNASWKKKGVTMYGVRTDGTKEEWMKFIRDNHLKGWIHAWDPGYTSNYRKFYDVYATPVVYLLDENKKILAKRLGVTQLDEFLERLSTMKPRP
ncbi:MAG: redoxin domain-containing protein [Chitinophaga sp.]